MINGGTLAWSCHADRVVVGIGTQGLLLRDGSAAKDAAHPARIRVGNLLLQRQPERVIFRVQLIQIVGPAGASIGRCTSARNQLGPLIAGIAGLEQKSARQLLLDRQCPLLRIRRAAMGLDVVDSLALISAWPQRCAARWDWGRG